MSFINIPCLVFLFMTQQGPPSLPNDPGLRQGEDVIFTKQERHDILVAPCPIQRIGPVAGPVCSCPCFLCLHRLRLGTAHERRCYLRFHRKDRDKPLTDEHSISFIPISEPPIRMFPNRPRTHWGNMRVFPNEIREMIVVQMGEYTRGVAGLRQRQQHLDLLSHGSLTLAVGQGLCTEGHDLYNRFNRHINNDRD